MTRSLADEGADLIRHGRRLAKIVYCLVRGHVRPTFAPYYDCKRCGRVPWNPV